jgi:alpha-galactosidase
MSGKSQPTQTPVKFRSDSIFLATGNFHFELSCSFIFDRGTLATMAALDAASRGCGLAFSQYLCAFMIVVFTCGVFTTNGASFEKQVILKTPPMGADLWYTYGPSWTEKEVLENVDCAATNGLVELGWEYVMLTDGWQGSRINGKLTPDPAKIANITNLIQYIHNRGMKVGIYTEPRLKTSAGFTGSEGFLAEDAETFASWGVDYVQFDMPQAILDGEKIEIARQFVSALRRVNTKPIAVYSSGFNTFHEAAPEVLDCARWVKDLGYVSGPLRTLEARWTNYLVHLDRSAAFPDAVRPGFWIHPDHIPVSDERLGYSQAVFSMNALIAAPLFVHRFLPRHLYPTTYSIYTNSEIIAINQDILGDQARPVWSDGNAQVWVKVLADGSRAVGLLNRGTNGIVECMVNWNDIGLVNDVPALVRDCWLHKDIGIVTGSYAQTIPAVRCSILRITPINKPQLKIAEFKPTEAHLDIFFPARGNYSVETSTDLLSWSRLILFTNQVGHLRFIDTNPQGPYRFYRGGSVP